MCLDVEDMTGKTPLSAPRGFTHGVVGTILEHGNADASTSGRDRIPLTGGCGGGEPDRTQDVLSLCPSACRIVAVAIPSSSTGLRETPPVSIPATRTRVPRVSFHLIKQRQPPCSWASGASGVVRRDSITAACSHEEEGLLDWISRSTFIEDVKRRARDSTHPPTEDVEPQLQGSLIEPPFALLR